MYKYLFLSCLFFKAYAGEFQLSVTERQEECLSKILYSLSEKNAGSLLFNAFSLRSMGKEVDPVAPLDFLYVVMNDPELFAYLKNVQGKYFQWNAFISGFCEKCNRDSVYLDTTNRLESFADALDMSVDKLNPYVEKKDWKGLIKCLLKRRVI